MSSQYLEATARCRCGHREPDGESHHLSWRCGHCGCRWLARVEQVAEITEMRRQNEQLRCELEGVHKAYALMAKGMESQCELYDGAKQELRQLRAAVTEHHAQKGDDRCIEDDDRLYAAAGLPPCDRRVGSKLEMLANCARFIERRCEGGGWPSYAELEAQNDELRRMYSAACDRIAAQSELLSRRAEKVSEEEAVNHMIYEGCPHG